MKPVPRRAPLLTALPDPLDDKTHHTVVSFENGACVSLIIDDRRYDPRLYMADNEA